MPGAIIPKILLSFTLLLLWVSCSSQSPVNPPTASHAAATAALTSTIPTNLQTPTTEKSRRARQPAENGPQKGAAASGSAVVLDTTAFNIILGRPTDHSVTASFYALEDAQVVVRYQSATGKDSTQEVAVNLQANIPQSVDLTGLLPDTEYTYQVTTNGQPAGGPHSFHTQRLPGSTFTFTLDADTHNRDPNFNGELYATTLSNARQDHPDFHINLGDTFMTEKVQAKTYAEAESTFTDLRPYFGVIGADAPVFLVNGNHEGEIGWLLNSQTPELGIWSTQLRQLYYPNPYPNSFYSGAAAPDPILTHPRDGYFAWTWGDALFIVLDPFWYTTPKPQPADLNNNWNWTLGKAQYDWLQSTLETSPSKYKFIFIHHLVGGSNTDARGGIEAAPYFEWGGKNADGSYGFDQRRPDWGKPIHQMLVENHVSAVFHGHDHVYVKQELDGIIYQEVPQPSMAQYNKTSLAADYGYLSGDVLGSSGHLRVTVTPEQVIVEYARAYLPKDENQGQQNGQVDAQYTVSQE